MPGRGQERTGLCNPTQRGPCVAAPPGLGGIRIIPLVVSCKPIKSTPSAKAALLPSPFSTGVFVLLQARSERSQQLFFPAHPTQTPPQVSLCPAACAARDLLLQEGAFASGALPASVWVVQDPGVLVSGVIVHAGHCLRTRSSN